MEEQKSILVIKRTFGWEFKMLYTIKISIQKHRGLPCVSDEQRKDHKTEPAWHVWGTDMHEVKNWAHTLINTVLSECKMCEGEMKLITCNDEVRFKSSTLCAPTRSRVFRMTVKTPPTIPSKNNFLSSAKFNTKHYWFLLVFDDALSDSEVLWH